MLIALIFAAALTVPDEAELRARLPDIFARSAAHYRALDAAATSLMKDEKGEPRTPHGFNRTTRQLDMRSVFWWTSGHYPGSLWHLYEATGDTFFRERATVWTEILAPVAKYSGNHDVGFMMYCSYGNARRLLETDRYDALLRETAESLCKRYEPDLGLIRSWGKIGDSKEFLVIPGNMMNLELLEWAARQKGGERFGAVARSHADVSMKHHFRPDGGCYHVLNYDQRPGFLGSVREIRRGQGLSCETAWSRGQSWGIYGYTMMYRSSGFVRYLDFAKKLADYAISHPNMPDDGVPYWDYGAPGEERDTSAASVMASALLELSQYAGGADRARYRAFAVKQLLSLASPTYFSEGDEAGHFLLKHGVGHKPDGSEVDTPLDYGDYYFLEALLRFRELKAQEAKCVSLAAKLPAKAGLPADELTSRPFGRGGELRKVAEQALVQQIPDTADDLYGEFWTTGNRTRYEDRYCARVRNLDALALTETSERKGRYLARLADYLWTICKMKSWVFPAHDYSEGGGGTFRSTWITTDLFSTELGAHLACIVCLLGDRLDPALVARVKAECERRVFAPLRREARFRFDPGLCDESVNTTHLWWINGENNWNAVCWDNVVCCALGLLDDPIERAQFVSWADRAAEFYLKDGFAADGYCSEGMGYWNYGFGHHLQTGRLLDEVTGGRSDFFRRPKQKVIAAYARAYTLREGASPAFADGNGAASKTSLDLIDRYWPDLPKALPPQSEFPDGQVWLFRDPDGLSVAFKGGHNGELHNHNDIGSYYVMFGENFVAGDAGGEEYTRFTFSDQRYDSKINNSFGHPVPVVGGKLQGTGAAFKAKVVSKDLVSEKPTVILDLASAYDVPALKTLTRTFAYDRAAGTFTVTDRVEFSEPTAFESPFNTYLESASASGRVNNGRVKIGWNVRPEIATKGGDYELVEEDVPNPNRIAPHRVAVRFKKPVSTAEVSMTYRTPRGTVGFRVEVNRPSRVYEVGEEAVFAVTATNGAGEAVSSGHVKVVVSDYTVRPKKVREVDLSSENPFIVRATLGEPGFVLVELSGEGVCKTSYGAGFSPTKIPIAGMCPPDFDAFWTAARAKLAREVPLDPRLVHCPERSKGAFDVWRASFATFGGQRVWGHLSVPKDKSKAPFPVRFTVSSAGQGWWTWYFEGARRQDSCINMCFTVHAFEPPTNQEDANRLHAQLRKELEDEYGIDYYPDVGLDRSREDYYFYRPILGIDRAVDWLWSRPDVDRAHFSYVGGSQGGGLGMALMGLNRKFTAGFLRVPAMMDMLGLKIGRVPGFPYLQSFYRDKQVLENVLANAAYYNGSYFASRITCPIRISMGFIDTTCPPNGVYAAYNAIRVADKRIHHGLDCGHGGWYEDQEWECWFQNVQNVTRPPRQCLKKEN